MVKKYNFPDPILFQRFLPLIEEWLNQEGGMENILKQHPDFAKLVLPTTKKLKNQGAQSWLINNFPISFEETEDSLKKIEKACEQTLGGETDNTTDKID